MTASPYNFSTSGLPEAEKQRRFNLPNLRTAGLGGGLALLIVGVGLLVIGLGWNGMAGGGGEVNGVPNLNAQLPWLVSGGILGLALVVFGAAMLIVHNARLDRARLESKLDELVTAIGRQATSTTVPYPAQPATLAAGTFVAGASAFHAPDCRLVQGRDDVELVSAVEADARNLRACRVCKPLESAAR
jgi:hypothetical protein